MIAVFGLAQFALVLFLMISNPPDNLRNPWIVVALMTLATLQMCAPLVRPTKNRFTRWLLEG